MGFLDTILGRSKPVRPDLDNLFGLPSAAITLATVGVKPTGSAAVAFRAPEGKAFADVQAEITELLERSSGPTVELQTDEYGYSWLMMTTDPPDISELVTGLHAINVSLQDAGFGSSLLCSLVSFTDRTDRRFALVYLFKQGTFYPFVPEADGSRLRDNISELKLRDLIADDVAVERDLTRWFALWGAPGLDSPSEDDSPSR